MPNEKDCVTVSFLMTEEDLADSRLLHAKSMAAGNDRRVLKILGLALILTGGLTPLALGASFYTWMIAALLFIVGLINIFYYDTLLPYLIRNRAHAYALNNREKMTAQTVALSQGGVGVSSARYTAEIPYSHLQKAAEDAKVFVLFFGADEMRVLPKRAASEEECAKARQLLQAGLAERFRIL